MKNGCEECEKLDDDKICDMCQLAMLEWTAQTAVDDYVNKVNEILSKKVKVQNGIQCE